MKVPELLIEVIVTGIMTDKVARTTYNSCKAVNLFVEEEDGQLFEEVLHIHPTCYSMLHNVHRYLMFNVRIYSMEVEQQKQHFL